MKLSSKARILVVDDSRDICFLLSQHLANIGFSVEIAYSGEEALKLLDKNFFEIVICDIIMPGIKGTQLLQKAKKRYPAIHFIMITGYVSLEHILTCMKYGADTCIFKPITSFTEIDEAINNALISLNKWKEKIIALDGLREMDKNSLELITEVSGK